MEPTRYHFDYKVTILYLNVLQSMRGKSFLILCLCLILPYVLTQDASAETSHDDENAHKSEVNVDHEFECEEHNAGADTVMVLFVMILLGLGARYCLRCVPVPYTALLLIAGMSLGAIQIRLTSHTDIEGSSELDIRGHHRWEKFAIGIRAWQSLDPELLLLVFLPALIFSSAFSLDFHITKRSFGQVLILAGPGVIIGTILTAVFVKYAFPYDWCWPKALMFGAMISATDPVAVVALLKEVGASQRLGTVIEGESLFNDGTAFVFFLLFRDMIPTSSDCLHDKNNCLYDSMGSCEEGLFEPTTCIEDRSLGESIGFFLQLALGGPALGVLFGIVATFWIQYIYNDLLTEISVTLVTAYLTFYVAEDVAEVSGVLAVVSLGLFMGSFAKDRISSSVHEPLDVFWEMMEYVANTLIFVYTGLKISLELFDSTNPNSDYIQSAEWGYAVLLYLVLQVIRLLILFALLPILSRMGYGMTWKDALVAVWGGLRGAVGLALALIVQLDSERIPPSFRSYTIFYLGFVVIATLLINGTTMPYLLKALGITKTSPEKLEVLFHLLTEMEEDGEKRNHNEYEDDLLGMPDYDEVKKLTALDIHKIVPRSKEIERVVESAMALNRPSAISLQNNMHRTALRQLTLSRANLERITEDAHGEQIVNIEPRKPKSWWRRVKDRFSGDDNKKSTIPDTPRKNTFTIDLLIQDLRYRLLQSVKTAYAESLEKGYINARCMFDLIAATDNAVDHLGEPICDWRYLESIAKPSRWRVEVQKIKRFACQNAAGDVLLKGISKLLFDSMLQAVLLSRTFILAHIEAEHTLREHIKSEMGDDLGMSDPRKMHMLEEATTTVIAESKDVTKNAYQMMRDFKMAYPEILRSIKTRLSAQEILLEKQAYVHQIERAGLIEQREASLIRDTIDAKIKFLTYNTLVLHLPNLHDLLHSHALFSALPVPLFDSQIWPHAKPKVFTKGNKIYSLGGEPKHVTVVVRGLVKMVDILSHESPIGDGFGSVLGVSEIMLNRPRAITMLCETTVEVIQIDRQIFETWVERFTSVRVRAWQLTAMMLTFLSPWGDFTNNSIIDLATVFRSSQVLEFEPEQELRVKSRSYLLTGTVTEAGFVSTPRTVVGPAPLGPGMGVYTCVSHVLVLRIPDSGSQRKIHTLSPSFGNTRKMLSRSSASLSDLSVNHGSTYQAGTSSLLKIPEGRSSNESHRTGEDTETPSERTPRRFEYALSADLETRRSLSRKISRRGSIEF